MFLDIETEIRLVRDLEAAITAYWAQHCFVPWRKHEWVRRWGWKSDLIRVTHEKHFRLLVDFGVEVPPEPDDIRECVGYTNLIRYVPPQSRTFKFPRFAWTTGRFVQNIMQLMPHAVDWLADYDTPAKCIERQLADPNQNPNSPSVRYCQRYVQDLPEDAAKGCCLLNLKPEYPKEDHEVWRSLFDVHWQGPAAKLAEEDPALLLKVGDPVLDEYGMDGTVTAIDRAALDGAGSITIRYSDGSMSTLPLDDSGLQPPWEET